MTECVYSQLLRCRYTMHHILHKIDCENIFLSIRQRGASLQTSNEMDAAAAVRTHSFYHHHRYTHTDESIFITYFKGQMREIIIKDTSIAQSNSRNVQSKQKLFAHMGQYNSPAARRRETCNLYLHVICMYNRPRRCDDDNAPA